MSGDGTMEKPWDSRVTLDAAAAVALIEKHFPQLAPASAEPFGDGWDNSAFLVNGELVFRFPRREVAVRLMATECAVLPLLQSLPLPVPRPIYSAPPDSAFPWPFSGYSLLPGRTACDAALDESERVPLAAPLGRFLAELHRVDVPEAKAAGAPDDELRRLDVEYRVGKIKERLRDACDQGLIDDGGSWDRVLADAPSEWTPRRAAVVHGDLYARHLLLDDGRNLCGIIDWGDVHVGDPAVDISVAHGFLPPSAHDVFRDAYRHRIDGEAWAVARLRALHAAVTTLVYGADVEDESLVRESRTALDYLAR